MNSPSPLPLRDSASHPLGDLLCYPRYEEGLFRERLEELRQLGVVEILPLGKMKICDFPVLGKGYVSLVAAALLGDGRRCALKILRRDSGRPSMDHEVEMLKISRSLGIGPQLYGSTPNFLALELISGEPFHLWVEGLSGRGRKARLLRVVGGVLAQCRSLDRRGLDHGELSRAHRHILVGEGDEPRIIDFETASTERRPSNVTATSQYLFLGSAASIRVRGILRWRERDRLIEALRRYKRGMDEGSFHLILKVLGLENPARLK